MVDGRCLHGGLTDRIRGCLTTFTLSEATNQPFFLNWVYPFDIQRYLMPNEVDWVINPSDIVYAPEISTVSLVYVVGFIGENRIDKWLIRKAIKTNSCQKHIYSNANFGKSDYSRSFKKLFKPAPRLSEAIDACKASMGGQRYVSFTFRFQELLGDFKELDSCKTLDNNEAKQLMDKCRLELKRKMTAVPSEYRILVTSDSVRFLTYVKNIDDRIYIVPGSVMHFNIKEDGGSDPYLKSFVDFYMLMDAEIIYLMKTGEMYNSGFPRFAAQIGNKPFKLHKF